MHISQAKVDKAKSLIPDQDFASPEFDKDYGREPTTALFIWSTPRSGSTFLCDLLYRSGLCLPHEYFQPYEYIPLLANRWNCINIDRELVECMYIENLFRFRTSESRCIGLNLHGEHIKTFLKFENYFANLMCKHIHLKRKDQIRQSVSYEIASQTKKWSTHFTSKIAPEYSYNNLLIRLKKIQSSDALISAYLKSRGLPFTTMYYEDLIKKPTEQLKPILPVEAILTTKEETKLQKQSNSLSDDWTGKFINEIIERDFMPTPPPPTLRNRIIRKINHLKRSF